VNSEKLKVMSEKKQMNKQSNKQITNEQKAKGQKPEANS